MRQVILDTETTGLNANKGDRIIEIGCVEVIDRKRTDRHFHAYLNPERPIPAEAVAIHGIDDGRVRDCPKFRDIAVDLWAWLENAELIIHNAAFDMGFLNSEYQRFADEQQESFERLETVCSVVDTLKIAREKYPGAKASLDALCKRYGIDNSHRTLHGALLDAEILADVYLMLTGGQTTLSLEEKQPSAVNQLLSTAAPVVQSNADLVVIPATSAELKAHQEFLALLAERSDKTPSW